MGLQEIVRPEIRNVVPSLFFLLTDILSAGYAFSMYIRVKSSKLSPRKSVQIVKSVRTGKRVSQVILQHVGIAHDEKQLSEPGNWGGSSFWRWRRESSPLFRGSPSSRTKRRERRSATESGSTSGG